MNLRAAGTGSVFLSAVYPVQCLTSSGGLNKYLITNEWGPKAGCAQGKPASLGRAFQLYGRLGPPKEQNLRILVTFVVSSPSSTK